MSMNHNRKQGIAVRTYDKSEMRTRQKERIVILDFSGVSNNTTGIKGQRKTKGKPHQMIYFKLLMSSK